MTERQIHDDGFNAWLRKLFGWSPITASRIEIEMLRERAKSAVMHEEQVRAELNQKRTEIDQLTKELAALRGDNRWLEATLRQRH